MQGLQIGDDVRQLLAGEILVGHQVAGLGPCGFSIHRASAAGLLGSTPAARVRRVAKCVRSGALCAPAVVPRTWWHRPQRYSTNARPRCAAGSLGAVAACSCAVRQRSKTSRRLGNDLHRHVRVL